MTLLDARFHRIRLPAYDWHKHALAFAGLARGIVAALVVLNLLAVANGAIPAYMHAQTEAITASAARHGVPPAWLAAVLYNEMVGTEDQFLRAVIPGDGSVPSAARSTILGLHLISLKQLQWQAKSLVAMAGANPTLGPAGIRVTVGREIRSEASVAGGFYVPGSWLERASMIIDLSAPGTAIEYLAANLQRGQERLLAADRGNWDASARWHNTGVVYDSAIVRPDDWAKGTRYIARVRSSLPLVSAMLGNGQRSMTALVSGPMLPSRGQPAAAMSPAASTSGPP